MQAQNDVKTIKQVAEETGVSIDTLRYYERIGLVDPVDRAHNGHRRYTAFDVNRVQFLKRLRATGMPIRDMLHYVELYRAGDTTITERREMLQDHRAGILAQIDALHETLDMIDGKITRYLEQEQERDGQ